MILKTELLTTVTLTHQFLHHWHIPPPPKILAPLKKKKSLFGYDCIYFPHIKLQVSMLFKITYSPFLPIPHVSRYESLSPGFKIRIPGSLNYKEETGRRAISALGGGGLGRRGRSLHVSAVIVRLFVSGLIVTSKTGSEMVFTRGTEERVSVPLKKG